jgi:hypothetical protein
MYGLVNQAVQDLVVSKFGASTWNQIKLKAGVAVEAFSRMDPYPDELTYRLVSAASEVLGMPPDDVLVAFGEHWVLFTGREGYGHMFDAAGSTLKDFLLNLDNLHGRVGQNFAKLVPPSFSFDALDGGALRMHYHSERRGLCPMVRGLVQGLSKHFREPIDIQHPVCSRDGAEHCEFLLAPAGGNV